MDNNQYRKKQRPTRRYMTGEDIDMLHERDYESNKKREVPICDRHIDGA